jgi:N-acetylmuramoyl-L-alanine amidase
MIKSLCVIMKKILYCLTLLFGVLFILYTQTSVFDSKEIITGAPPYDAGPGNVSPNEDFSWLQNWTRPDGPPKVALQVGHWKNHEVPDELHKLRGNTGATGGGKSEWEVNHAIATNTQTILEQSGIVVEILPATVPPRYWADVFVAIHADGSLDPYTSGFKAAAPRRDYTGKASTLAVIIENSYGASTLLTKDPVISRNMTGYYAFSWWRYEHAVHPMTTSVILETGFLTSAHDREIIVDQPKRAAEGLAQGIYEYLVSEDLLSQR